MKSYICSTNFFFRGNYGIKKKGIAFYGNYGGVIGSYILRDRFSNPYA